MIVGDAVPRAAALEMNATALEAGRGKIVSTKARLTRLTP